MRKEVYNSVFLKFIFDDFTNYLKTNYLDNYIKIMNRQNLNRICKKLEWRNNYQCYVLIEHN